MSPVVHWPTCWTIHSDCAVTKINEQRERLIQLEFLRGNLENENRRWEAHAAALRDEIAELRRRLGDVAP